jgi:hypothetical protein
MAGQTKTTFIGSTYAFEPSGVDEFMDRFRCNYAKINGVEENEAPLIEYIEESYVRTSRSQACPQS